MGLAREFWDAEGCSAAEAGVAVASLLMWGAAAGAAIFAVDAGIDYGRQLFDQAEAGDPAPELDEPFELTFSECGMSATQESVEIILC